MAKVRLGVNIDHVATLRQARGGDAPSVLEAAKTVNQCGAHGVTVHLREDRRHIQDADVFAIRKAVHFLNLEMAAVPEIIEISVKLKPNTCCLVPEKRKELTTEGGLNVVENFKSIHEATRRLQDAGITVSLFVDPDLKQLEAAARTGARYVELHTGDYAHSIGQEGQMHLERLQISAAYAQTCGLRVNAGHGLNYENVQAVARIPGIEELNIGHAIVAKALFVGMEQAVQLMLKLIKNAR